MTEDRSMVAWCWGGERDYKGHKEIFGSNGYLDCGGGFFHMHAQCACVWKLIILYPLNMCNLLYMN